MSWSVTVAVERGNYTLGVSTPLRRKSEIVARRSSLGLAPRGAKALGSPDGSRSTRRREFDARLDRD
ncbi:MAG TPA: hypothetical protein VME22_27655 [Solirubrobacteraceae bacterium]|nr:hypothetical protein [Solirubrobacteraceae bacterium]